MRLTCALPRHRMPPMWEDRSNHLRRIVKRSVGLIGGLLLFAVSAPAERLPIKTYTATDGLVRDSINRIVRDAQGFLWFCTDGGLSRFDGYQFTNYTTEDGLPSPAVNDLLETRRGIYWVATSNGLCRFNPMAAKIDRPSRKKDSARSRA